MNDSAETKRMLLESLVLAIVAAVLLALPYWALPAQPPTHTSPTPPAATGTAEPGGEVAGTERPGCAAGEPFVFTP